MPRIGRALREMSGDRVPFALVVASTRAAREAKGALVSGMQAAFDRPTRWTLGGVYVEPATKASPVATVHLKDVGGGATVPAGKYLRPQILGGARQLKGYERRLAMRAGYVTVPGKWAEMDAHGNISRGQLNAIKARLNLFNVRPGGPDYGFGGARRRGARRREEYFIVPLGRTEASHPGMGHLPPGIYRRGDEYGGAPLLVLAFVRQYGYQRRFDFAGIGGRAVEESLPRLIEQAIAQGFASPRAR